MRLAWVLILAFVVSVVAGGVACAGVSFLPDWDDAASRGLDEALRVALTLAYVVLGVVLYGFAVWRRDRERRVRRTLAVLLLVPVLIVVLGLIDNGPHTMDWRREGVGMVQMFTPLWAVALAQWIILHIYLSRRTMLAKAVST